MIGIGIEVVMVLLLSALNASVLQWRARKLQAWGIDYKDAYWVSVKAGLVAFVSLHAVRFSIGFVGIGNAEQEAQFLYSAGLLFFLLGWFLSHSSGLLKLAGKSRVLTLKEVRAVSSNVFGYFAALIFALAFVFNILKASLT